MVLCVVVVVCCCVCQLSCESSTVGCEGDEEVLAKAQGDKPTAMKRLHTYIRTQQVSQPQTEIAAPLYVSRREERLLLGPRE